MARMMILVLLYALVLVLAPSTADGGLVRHASVAVPYYAVVGNS